MSKDDITFNRKLIKQKAKETRQKEDKTYDDINKSIDFFRSEMMDIGKIVSELLQDFEETDIKRTLCYKKFKHYENIVSYLRTVRTENERLSKENGILLEENLKLQNKIKMLEGGEDNEK